MANTSFGNFLVERLIKKDFFTTEIFFVYSFVLMFKKLFFNNKKLKVDGICEMKKLGVDSIKYNFKEKYELK